MNKNYLKEIVTEEFKNITKEKDNTYLENNGLELCADWLESEKVSKSLNLSSDEEKEAIDYMVQVFYKKLDNNE